MADDTLAKHLAEILYHHWHGRTAPPFSDRASDIRSEYLTATAALLTSLAERGRLVSDGATVETEWGARFPDQPVAAANGEEHLTLIVECLDSFAEARSLPYRSEKLRRQHITTPWEPVPATPEETT
jgi:hypothetical protein